MNIWDEQWKIISLLIDAVIYSSYVVASYRAALLIFKSTHRVNFDVRRSM